MSDVPMVNVYEADRHGVEQLVYRPANEDELVDLAERQQAFAGSEQAILEGAVQALLHDCDWTQLADAPIDVSKRESWAEYRQQLRGYTSRPGFDPLDPPPLPTPPG